MRMPNDVLKISPKSRRLSAWEHKIQPSHWARLAGVMLLSCIVAACVAASRLPAPPESFSNAVPPGFSSHVRLLSGNRAVMVSRLQAGERTLLAASHGGPIQILALSGGGAGGAFGAGVLYGLEQAGKLPRFQAVTGVSAGALLAPFAFLGPSWDRELQQAFDGRVAEHLLQRRSLLSILLHPGIYQRGPLERLVQHFVTPEMIRAVAARAREGHILLVATTDIDSQQSVIWNLGAVAEKGGKPAQRLFSKILVASASIPGIFPPVLIRLTEGHKKYQEMLVDGGTTQPFFVVPDLADIVPMHLPGFTGAKVYVIINGKLNTYPKTTPRTPMSVLSRSFSAALLYATRRAVLFTAWFASQYHMHFKFTYLPTGFEYGGDLDFKYSNMHELFNYGWRCAKSGKVWSTVAAAVSQVQRSSLQLPKASSKCPAT